jgi:hypothetical protein
MKKIILIIFILSFHSVASSNENKFLDLPNNIIIGTSKLENLESYNCVKRKYNSYFCSNGADAKFSVSLDINSIIKSVQYKNNFPKLWEKSGILKGVSPSDFFALLLSHRISDTKVQVLGSKGIQGASIFFKDSQYSYQALFAADMEKIKQNQNHSGMNNIELLRVEVSELTK